jgi:ATP-binding cassette, subfamily B, bacterial MsbA
MKVLAPFGRGTRLDAITRRFSWTVPIVAMLSIVGSLLEAAGISLIVPLLNTLLLSGATSVNWPFGNLLAALPQSRQIFAIVVAMFALIVMKNLIVLLNQTFMAWIDGAVGHQIRIALSDCIVTVGYPFFLVEDPSRLVNIVATESWRASDGIRSLLLAIAAGSAVAMFVLFLLLLDWRLSLTVIAGMLLIRIFEHRMITRTRRLGDDVSGVNERLASRMMTGIIAMRLIRVFGQQERERQEFALASQNVRSAIFAVERHSATVSPLLEVLHMMLFIGVLLLGLWAKQPDRLPVLVAFLVLLQRIQPYLRNLEFARLHFASANGAFQAIEWLLAAVDKSPPPSGRRQKIDLEDGIRFRYVSYRYPTRRDAPPALENVNLHLPPGCAVALIGESGSGKSTIVNLLCRLIDPDAGVIQIGDVPLVDIDPAAWVQEIGLAGQDIDLVDGTIASNIAYGDSNLSDDDIMVAARLAQADTFICSLPQGYATEIGMAGLQLSGGQRQRIGLARAFAKKPRLLILDEATNAVDQATEAAIVLGLKQQRWPHIVVVVSHRSSTLAVCDRGFVMRDGRVVEQWPSDVDPQQQQLSVDAKEFPES